MSVERVLRYYGSPVSDALKCKNTLKSIVCVDDTGFSKRALLSFLSTSLWSSMVERSERSRRGAFHGLGTDPRYLLFPESRATF